uniref:Uncharacterized protein n=1 Tax=Psilocybe cubensis TaxID=181762 RepID=A0A8H7XM51_PSICU
MSGHTTEHTPEWDFVRDLDNPSNFTSTSIISLSENRARINECDDSWLAEQSSGPPGKITNDYDKFTFNENLDVPTFTPAAQKVLKALSSRLYNIAVHVVDNVIQTAQSDAIEYNRTVISANDLTFPEFDFRITNINADSIEASYKMHGYPCFGSSNGNPTQDTQASVNVEDSDKQSSAKSTIDRPTKDLPKSMTKKRTLPASFESVSSYSMYLPSGSKNEVSSSQKSSSLHWKSERKRQKLAYVQRSISNLLNSQAITQAHALDGHFDSIKSSFKFFLCPPGKRLELNFTSIVGFPEQ